MLGPVLLLHHTELLAQHDQGHLGGVADGRAVLLVVGGVAGQQRRFQQQSLNIVGQFQIVALQQSTIGVDLLRGHFVLGQGAGFVGTDDGHAAQTFHGLQILDDGVLTGHFLGAHGQNDGDDGGQGLGDGGHGQSHGKHQGVENTHACAEHRQGEHQDGNGYDNNGQLGAETVQTLLQGGLALLGLVHEGGDFAQLRVHTGAGDQHRGSAIGDQGAGKHHVFLVSQRHLIGVDGVGGFVHALAFTGQGAFVDLEGKVLQNAAVGHHHVTGLQQYNVAGDHLRRGDFHAFAASQDLGGGRRHGLEAFQRLFRLQILDGAQDGVENQDREDDNGALHVAGGSGDAGGHNENEHQQVLELLQEHTEHALFLAFGQLVGPVLPGTLGHLLFGEPVGAGLLTAEGLLRRLSVIGFGHRDASFLVYFVLNRMGR